MTTNTATPAKKKSKQQPITDYRKLRLKLDLNQSEFWGRLGVTQSGGSRYESTRKPPKPVAVLAHVIYIQKLDIDARNFK